jgi:hypothetical protein
MDESPADDVATAVVERGTLSGSTRASGSLAFANTHELRSALAGVVTWMPPAGSDRALGDPLYAIDNQPVFLFGGALPAWRALASGIDDGPDVTQLEESLAALGFFDRQPDEEFTSATTAAIEEWQEATGQPQTGTIDLGRVVFQAGPVRISATTASVGEGVAPGAAVLTVSGMHKEVKVELKLADQKLAQVGQTVTIGLPGGVSTTGSVVSVGVPTEKESNGQKSVVIPVVVALDDAGAAGDLQQASVWVEFPSDTRENVLSVPVEALIAVSAGSFGVEVLEGDGATTRVAVTTGLFAGGRVEVSGDGIEEGQEVVVPSR